MPITSLPTAPSRALRPADFANQADAFLAALPAFGTEATALESNVNAKEASAVAAAATAVTKAEEASGSADEALAQASGTVATGSAKDWATKTSAEVVAGQGFGAKKYADDAALSEAAAAASALEAAGLVESYQGALAADPTLDKDGNPLAAGDWYINTATGVVRAYNGSAWVQGISVVAGVSSLNGLTGALTGFVTETAAQSLTNKTLADPKLSLGGSQGSAGQVPVSQGTGLPPVWGGIETTALVKHVGGGLLTEDAVHLIFDPTTATYTVPDLTSFTQFAVSTSATPRSSADKRPVSALTLSLQDDWKVSFTQDSNGDGPSVFSPFPGPVKNGAWPEGLHIPPNLPGGQSVVAVNGMTYCQLSETLYVIGYTYGNTEYFVTFDTSTNTFGPTAVNSYGSGTMRIFSAGADRFVAFWEGSGPTLVVLLGVVGAGNTITLYQNAVSGRNLAQTLSRTIKLSDSLFVLVTPDSVNNYGYLTAVSISGTSITIGSLSILHTDTYVDRTTFLSTLSTNSFFVTYTDSSGVLRSRTATVSGTTITLNTEYATTLTVNQRYVFFYEYAPGSYAIGGGSTTSTTNCVLYPAGVFGKIVIYGSPLTIANQGTGIADARYSAVAGQTSDAFVLGSYAVNVSSIDYQYVNSIVKSGGALSTGTQLVLSNSFDGQAINYSLQKSFEGGVYLVRTGNSDSNSWMRKLTVDTNQAVSVEYSLLNARVVTVYTDQITERFVNYGDSWFARTLAVVPSKGLMIDANKGFTSNGTRPVFVYNFSTI